MAQGLDLGLAKSISHFNMLCMSVLSYVGQLYAPTPEVLKQEERMLQVIVRGPFNAIPSQDLQNLQSIGFPNQAAS
eukprot:2963943-Pyramimonas_sp.AAC.1